MEIKIGRYILKSDGLCCWLEEEYEGKTATGKVKKATRRVAGYAGNFSILLRQFVEHKHRASEATTVEELLREMKQIAEDTEAIKKTALANDFKLMRATGKKVREINK